MAQDLGSSSKLSDRKLSDKSQASQLVKISSLHKFDEITNEKENGRKESLKSHEESASSKLSYRKLSDKSEDSQLVKISSLHNLDKIKNEKENDRKESLKGHEETQSSGTANVSIGLGSIQSLLEANLSKEPSLNSRELFTGSIKSDISKDEEKSVTSEKSVDKKSVSIKTSTVRSSISEPTLPSTVPKPLPMSVSQFLPPVPSELSHRSQLMPQSPSEFSRPSQFPEDISVMISEFGLGRKITADSSFVHHMLDDFARSEKSFDMATYVDDQSSAAGQLRGFEYGLPLIDRKLFYDMYHLWLKRKRIEKFKNNFLQTRLAKYYMRRRMFYVLRETSLKWDEVIIKYEKDLERFGQLYEFSEREKTTILDEVKNLTDERDRKKSNCATLMQTLIQLEQDYAKRLTFDKTGRSNMDQLVERFIRRQEVQTKLLKDLRLRYIQLRNRCQEKMEATEALDYLGPGFRIMDYIQLKHDNRNLYDKFEEKETELIQLREACKHTTQILAHYREKRQVLDLDIEKMRETLESVENEFNDAREQLSYLKREKEFARKAIKKLRFDNGLLTYPKLIRDMEKSVNEADELEDKIDDLQTSAYKKQKKIDAVRRNMQWILRRRAEGRKSVALIETKSSGALPDLKDSAIILPKTISSVSLAESKSSDLISKKSQAYGKKSVSIALLPIKK